MQQAQQNTVTLNFSSDSYEFVKQEAERRNTDVGRIVSNALALYKLAKGKIVMFKDQKTNVTFETSSFAQESSAI